MSAYRPFVLALALCAAFVDPASGSGRAQALTAADGRYLDGLIQEFLFDPRGAQRVVVTTLVRTVWAEIDGQESEGWLVSGKDGETERVYFTDGAWIDAPDPDEIQKVDFRAACKAAYSGREDDKTAGARENDLALAAWLYRLGDKGLAAKALAAARRCGAECAQNREPDPRKYLRGELAWSAFSSMVNAYMVRADDEALSHGERLLRLYAEEAAEYPQAAQIVEELKRRQRKGTFGTEPPESWPGGFDGWDAQKKAAYLIDALDEVDARQDGQPGGVDLAADRRVAELIRLGDAAVPALLDALESDVRLTRSVHFWRDFSRDRTVLGAGEAALTALMSILRLQAFEPAATGDNFTKGGDAAAATMAQRLRAYWKQYGPLPFDERMMKVLSDPQAGFQARREAAENLSKLTEPRPLRTTIAPTVIGPKPERPPNPAVPKFSHPTVAEAILAAMDAELGAHDDAPHTADGLFLDQRHEIESTYLSALLDLGDQRIAPEAARRAAAAQTPRARREWAHAAHFLGDPKPFQAFAEDFRAGRIVPPADNEGVAELGRTIRTLVEVGSPEATSALDALAGPQHPLHQTVARQLLARMVWDDERNQWFFHPYCLSILRGFLDDSSLTGATQSLEKDTFARVSPLASSSGPAPDYLAALQSPRKEIKELTRDAAALQLGDLVIGAPAYHPFLPDPERRLAALKATLDHYAGSYVRVSPFAARFFGLDPWRPHYIPDLQPLGRAATADDVTAGRAVFHLDGHGKPTGQELPAAATYRKGQKRSRVLVVQAETGPGGEVTYGIVSREEILAVQVGELEDVKSFAELDREE